MTQRSKRKFEPKKVDKVVAEIIGSKPLKGGLLNERIKGIWEEQMGPNVMAYTRKTKFESDVLYVYLNSAPLAEELSYAKEEIIKNLNKALNVEAVEKLVFR